MLKTLDCQSYCELCYYPNVPSVTVQMTYQTAMVHLIDEAGKSLFRTLHGTPEEKLIWKPAETSRHALALTEECIAMLGFTAHLLNHRVLPEDMNMEWGKDGWKSVAEYEAAFQVRQKDFTEAVMAFPSEDLEKTIELPWATQTYIDTIAYPYWSTQYHCGQIN